MKLKKADLNLTFSPLSKIIIFAAILFSVVLIGGVKYQDFQEEYNRPYQGVRNFQPIQPKTLTPTPSPSVAGVSHQTIDPDPIVDCGPFQQSKQTIRVRKSECSKYVDCQIGQQWYPIPTVEECKKRQKDYLANYYKNKAVNSPQSTVNLVDCFVFGRTYKMFKEDCDKSRADEEKIGKQFPEQTTAPTHTPTISSPDEDRTAILQWNAKCREDYRYNLMALNAEVSALGISRSSYYEARKQQLDQQLNNCLIKE